MCGVFPVEGFAGVRRHTCYRVQFEAEKEALTQNQISEDPNKTKKADMRDDSVDANINRTSDASKSGEGFGPIDRR